jgi:Tol biopolymer transport system component
LIERASKRVLKQYRRYEDGRQLMSWTFGNSPETWSNRVDATPVFSPDGSRFAYRATKGKGWIVVCGGQQSDTYDQVWPPVFSRDGKKLAFACRTGPEVWWKVMSLTD